MPGKTLDLGHLSAGVIIPVLVLAMMVFGYFVGWPQITSLRESQGLLAAKTAAIDDQETSLSSVKKLLSDVESKQDSVALLDGALPTSPDIPELLANLEFLALQSGLVVRDLQIELAPVLSSSDEESPGTETKLGVILAEVSLSGQYPQLSAFFLNVEHNLRLLDVQNIEFGSADLESDAQNYTVSLKTYYQKAK